MKSALFSRFGENLRPVWRFWQLSPSQMRFCQNVLRMTWKERFVQFWKRTVLNVLKRIWDKCKDFDNFDAPKCDLAKTCSAWPENRNLYNFHEKRTVSPFWGGQRDDFDNFDPHKCDLAKTDTSVLYNFQETRPVFLFWREFEASVTILRTLKLTNLIWPKRAAHDLKRAFCTIFMKSALFSLFGENLRPVWRFWQLWRSQMRFGQDVLRMTWKERFVQFSWKAHCLAVLKRISGQCDELTTLVLKNAILPKRAAHDLQFSWKAHCFPVLERIWGQCDDFDNFHSHKCDFAKTCSAWPEKSVLYNFQEKRTVFPFWREFGTSVRILRSLTLTNLIWPKRAAHDLKRAFCTIFMKSALFGRFEENLRPVWRIDNFGAQKCDFAKTCCAWPRIFMNSALFSRFGENLRPVWRFWQLSPSQMRFCQNVLRMIWKERFVQFSWKAHCLAVLKRISGQCDELTTLMLKNAIWLKRAAQYLQFSWKAHCLPVLERIWGQCDDFDNFHPHKCDFAKTCSAWPEKSVLYNFHEKRTVWSFWREFEASVTNWQLSCSKMRFCQNVLRMTYNFHEKRTVFPFWREFEASVMILTTFTLTNAILPKRAPHDLKRAFCTIFMKSALFGRFEENLRPVWRIDNFGAQKCDFAKTCCAWPTIFMKSVLFSRFGENLRPVWRFWQLSLSQMRFCQNVLRMTWKERFVQFSWKADCLVVLKRIWGQCDELTTFVLKNAILPKRAAHDLQFSWKAHCYPVLERIWGQCDDFDNFHSHKCDFGKTCSAWPEKSVLYNFQEKRTVFPF